MTPLLGAKESAALLNVSEEMVYKLGRVGAIPTILVGTAVRFLQSDIEEFIQANRTTAPRPPRKRPIAPRHRGGSQ